MANSIILSKFDFSADIDMRNIYSMIFNDGAFDKKKCPQLIPNRDLPDQLDYIGYVLDGQMIGVATRKGLANYKILQILKGERDVKNEILNYLDYQDNLPFTNVKTDISTFYGMASLIATKLDMRCPPIFMRKRDERHSYNGNCYNNDFGKTTYIEICEREGFSFIDYVENLAHEMRHCWQHETDNAKYFSNYKYFLDYAAEKIEQYYLQPAEIDARAYGLLFVNAVTGRKYEPEMQYDSVNNAVKERMEQIGKLNIQVLFD